MVALREAGPFTSYNVGRRRPTVSTFRNAVYVSVSLSSCCDAIQGTGSTTSVIRSRQTIPSVKNQFHTPYHRILLS